MITTSPTKLCPEIKVWKTVLSINRIVLGGEGQNYPLQ